MSEGLCRTCMKVMPGNYAELCTACGKPDHWHSLGEGGKPIKGACSLIRSPHVPENRRMKVHKVFTGYGYRNNNKFCTLRCAFRWAVERAR